MKVAGLGDVMAVKGVLNNMFRDGKEAYHDDFALIICFLSDHALFKEFYADMSADMEDMYTHHKHVLKWRNALTYCFNDLFEILDEASGDAVGCRFPRIHNEEEVVASGWGVDSGNAQNITLTGGAASVFAAIVGRGYLFKDGTGPSHGEYAHTIQWLVIAYAKYYGRLQLEHPVLELYQQSVGLPFTNNTMLSLHPDEKDAALVNWPMPYWPVMVDCFRVTDVPEPPEEDLGANLFVMNYRSPSFLTEQMLRGELTESFIGQHLIARYKKRAESGFVTGHQTRDVVRAFYVHKQTQKKRAAHAVGEGVNLTVPVNSTEQFLEDLRGRVASDKRRKVPGEFFIPR